MLLPLKDDNPTRNFPTVTLALIAANIAVFLYQLSLGYGEESRYFIFRFGAIPYEIAHFTDIDVRAVIPPPLTILTAMFLHGGVMHLAGNMLYLWIFGNNIEDILGKGRFLLFYILCGILSGVTEVMAHPDSGIPMIGASGAVAGTLGAYAVVFPHARILVFLFLFIFIRMIYVPAIVVLGFWFLIQVFSAQGLNEGVAWYAHIGGFASGILLLWFLSGSRQSYRGNFFRRH